MPIGVYIGYSIFSKFSAQKTYDNTKDSKTQNYFTLSPSGEEEPQMNMSLLASHTSVRMNYADYQAKNTKDGQTPLIREKTESFGSDSSTRSASFSDLLEVASKDVRPINNIHAYITESVSRVLEEIADHASKTTSSQAEEYSVSITSISIKIELEEGESLEDAKNQIDSLLSEDGYWGVEKTSQRLFDFAHSMVGDDPEKLRMAQEAMQKGFDKAKVLMGGDLPQISYDTLEAANEKFDSYIERINGSLSATYA